MHEGPTEWMDVKGDLILAVPLDVLSRAGDA